MIRLTTSLTLCGLMVLFLAAGVGCKEESETPPQGDVSEEPLLPPTEPQMPPPEADDTDVTPLEGTPPPEEGASDLSAPPADSRIAEFDGFRAPKPVAWTWRPPAGSLRIANYIVPGQDGSDQTEVVVFGGIVGTPDQNVTRWVQQFSSPDGGTVEPTITMHEADGMTVHVVELSGTYQGVGVGKPEEDQLFLGAIVEAPGGDLHIRFVGPHATVDANREAFMEFVTGLERID